MTHDARAARRRRLLRVTLAIVLVGGLVAFFAAGGARWLQLDALKAHREALHAYAQANFAAAFALAFVLYVAMTLFSLPGGSVMSLAMGFVFGRWAGTVLVVTAATVGSTLLFLAARYVFADSARRRLGVLGERINAGFTQNAFEYMLFLRLVPAFPYFLVNLAPALTSIPVRTYVLATFIGIIPGTFVFVNLGESLGAIDSLAGLLTPQVLGAFALLGLLGLAPVLWRWWRSRRAVAHPHRRR